MYTHTHTYTYMNITAIPMIFLSNYFMEQLTRKLDHRYQEWLLQAKTKPKSHSQGLKTVATGHNSQNLSQGKKHNC